jgi:hypothetical protein
MNHGTLCQRSHHQLCRLLLYPYPSAFVNIYSLTWVLHSAKIEDYVSPSGKKRRKNENGAC